MEIRYLKHKEIDKFKWDELIESSPQSKIYAFSWYLDCMAEGWDALVGGDYQEVFPLPWNRKIFGYKKIYQPLLSQQLGLFTLDDFILKEKLHTYLLSIPEQFKLIDIQLNDCCPSPDIPAWIVKERINIELPLNADYDDLFSRYNLSKLKNLKKSEKFDLIVSSDISIDELMEIHYKHIKEKVNKYGSKKRKYFRRLAQKAIELNKGCIKVVKDSEGNIHSVKFLLFSSDRIYNLLDASTELGRKSAANNFLINEIIKEYAGSAYTLDFEGSMVPGIAFFFLGYGGSEKPYYQVIHNRLPGWTKFLWGYLVRDKSQIDSSELFQV